VAKLKATKREQQKIETRLRIYDIAMDLFARKGYTRVSVNDICEKAGVSKGTFYYYFSSKDQVILEEFLKIDQFYVESMEELSKKYKSPLKKLNELIMLSFQYTNNLGVKSLKVIYNSEIDPLRKKPRLASSKRPLYTIIEELVKYAQKQGELRSDVSIESITALYINCYRGIQYEWCLQNGRFDMVAAGAEFLKLVDEGLRKR
jgi:AcrR family transcriptional regulator